jgi:hypothetical protein
VLAALCWNTGQAQVPGAEPQMPAANPSAAPFFKPGGWSVSLFAGDYDVADEPQFVSTRHEYALGFGASAELYRYPWLALDFEMFFANRDYDTPVGPPLWGSIDNDTSVETSAFLVGARVFYPSEGAFRGYASAGLGYFSTKMIVYGSLFGFPGAFDETDSSMEFYYGAGFSYMFGRWGLSLDYRHFNLEGSFEGFNISDADLGGDLYLVGWRYAF